MCAYAVIGFFFFFQAEDGIRDLTVTGVQTCALPICLKTLGLDSLPPKPNPAAMLSDIWCPPCGMQRRADQRSEERRVGEEGRSRWSPDHLKKKKKGNRLVKDVKRKGYIEVDFVVDST